MERIVLVNCIVVAAFCLFVDTILPDQHNYATLVDAYNSGDTERKPYFWFGPRLGRRKRHPLVIDGNYRNHEIESLLDAIQDSPWVMVALNESKQHSSSYTPRLGRESGEELEAGGDSDSDRDRDSDIDSESKERRWYQDGDLSEYLFQRSPPFAPRLGRRLSTFSPRLGRAYDQDSALLT